MQLFVRGLASSTLACEVDVTSSVADLKRCIEEVGGLPGTAQQFAGLVFAGRQLQDDRSLSSYGIGAESTVHLVFGLAGGKGGFGALLRGLGRDGSKTTNNDAMRDLQGRRLRHQNAEAKLKEWESKAKERELEKIALQHIKQQEREARREKEQQVEVASIVEAQKAAVKGAQEAVQSALAAAKQAPGSSGAGPSGSNGNGNGATAAAGKRPASKAAAAPVAKRSKMMAALESFGSDEGESGSESSEGEDE